jgi:hypothetical protein
MNDTNPEGIIKRGYVDVKVFVTGLRQSHRLEVKVEKTAVGNVPFLICRHYIPPAEMVRLAEELKLPIKHKDTVVFPRGTSPASFAKKPSGKKDSQSSGITVEAQTIEAEIE